MAGTKRRYLRWAVYVALCAHIVVVAIALVVHPRWRKGGETSPRDGAPTTVDAAAPSDSAPSSVGVRARDPLEPSDDWNAIVQDRVLEKLADAEELSRDEKIDNLDLLTKRLEQVSDEQSIEHMAQRFHAWLGTSQRAGQPTETPVEGDFDFDTAQFHDIRRVEETSRDASRYVSTMLDAHGRTLEVEMSEEDGRAAYETMQRMKDYPLMDKVYRQIVMPMLDKAIAAKKQARNLARQAEEEMKQKQSDAVDSSD